MKKYLLNISTTLAWMIGFFLVAGSALAVPPGPPPDIAVVLSFDRTAEDPYFSDDPILVTLRMENLGPEEIMRKGWRNMEFWLLLQFFDEKGNIITSDKIRESSTLFPLPPRVFPDDAGVLVQGTLVELVENGWFIVFDEPPFDAKDYYPLANRSGLLRVKAVIPGISFLLYNQTNTGEKYAPRYPTDTVKWHGSLESNTASLTIVGDFDGDGYYYPLAYGTHTAVDCNDNNPDVNPGATEIPGNGIDDDCIPDTPDVVGKLVSFVIEKAKIDLKKPEAAKIDVKGKLELDLVYSNGVSISEDVTVVVGTVSETISGGTMKEKKGKWEYKRPKGGKGKIKKTKIDWKEGKLEFSMDKADLSGLTDPNNVTISIQIGDDFGQQTITMTVKHNKRDEPTEITYDIKHKKKKH